MAIPIKPCRTPEELAALIPEGASLHVGGFMGVGSPPRIIRALAERGTKGLTLICNDSGKPTDLGIAPLIHNRQVARLITSHIGLNPETQQQMIEGSLQVELTPQGSLVERIRAAGSGLGGVLTKTGLGTLAAEGKQRVEIDGEEWLLEKPIRADFALLGCHRADHGGNLEYSLTATNFNPVMALAAEMVIAEPEIIVPVGVLPPDIIRTPGVLVDYLVAHARTH